MLARKNLQREYRHLSKKTLLYMCSSRAAYHETRDAHLFNSELKHLVVASKSWMPSLLEARNGSSKTCGASQTRSMDYKTQVMFHSSLRLLARSVRSRHQNWQAFCARTDHTTLPVTPIRLLFELSVVLSIPSLQLLALQLVEKALTPMGSALMAKQSNATNSPGDGSGSGGGRAASAAADSDGDDMEVVEAEAEAEVGAKKDEDPVSSQSTESAGDTASVTSAAAATPGGVGRSPAQTLLQAGGVGVSQLLHFTNVVVLSNDSIDSRASGSVVLQHLWDAAPAHVQIAVLEKLANHLPMLPTHGSQVCDRHL